MREALMQKYPKRHDIPIEYHVAAFIYRIGDLCGEGVSGAEPVQSGQLPIQLRGTTEECQLHLRGIVQVNPKIKLKEGRRRLIEQMRRP